MTYADKTLPPRKTTQRQSGVELLRIFACFFVILLHYNNGGIGGGTNYISGTIEVFINRFTESLCFCAVDLFVMISGYFISTTQKRSFSKIVFLLLEASVIHIAANGVNALISQSTFSVSSVFSAFLDYGYFLILYSTTYLISPWINRAFNGIDKKRYTKAVLILFGIFSVAVTFFEILADKNVFGIDWKYDSPIGISGSMKGYTIVNFLLCYVIGGFVRNCLIGSIKMRNLILLFGGNLVVLIVWSYVDYASAFTYCNPLVIIEAALFIMIFSRIDFSSKIINELAKAGFTCYLAHGYFFKYLHIEYHVTSSWIIMCLHMAASAILLYLISYVIYKIYSILTNRLIKCTSPYINKISFSDTDEQFLLNSKHNL